MVNEQDVVVECECTELGESFCDPPECSLDRSNGNRVNLLKKWCARLAIGHVQDDAGTTFARDHEVALRVANTASCVDIQGSFRDHASAVESGLPPASVPSFPEHVRAMRLDSSAVGALDVSPDERTGYAWKIAVISFDALRNMFRRLIVQKVCFNHFLEFGLEADGASLCASVLPLRVCAVVCICRVVRPTLAREHLQLVPHRACDDTDRFRNYPQRVVLSSQYLNLVTIGSRQMRTFSLFSCAHTTQEIQIQKTICLRNVPSLAI